MKDVISALRYMKDSTVNKRLIDQATRVSQRIGDLDKNIMPNFQKTLRNGDTFGKWTSVGMQNRWDKWIKGRAAYGIQKATDYVDQNLEAMRNGYDSQGNRQRANQGTSDEDKALKVLLEKIDKLASEWADYKRAPWRNPF